MKPHLLQQEILLLATTTFSNRLWQAKDWQDDDQSSPADQLEEACWNGLLDDLLPELLRKTAYWKKLFVWQIRQYESFLQIELCEHPEIIARKASINPYLFLTTISCN